MLWDWIEICEDSNHWEHYIYLKRRKVRSKGRRIRRKTGKCYDDYRQMACFLRCDADMAEAEYRELQNQKKLIKTQNK